MRQFSVIHCPFKGIYGTIAKQPSHSTIERFCLYRPSKMSQADTHGLTWDERERQKGKAARDRAPVRVQHLQPRIFIKHNIERARQKDLRQRDTGLSRHRWWASHALSLRVSAMINMKRVTCCLKGDSMKLLARANPFSNRSEPLETKITVKFLYIYDFKPFIMS